MQHQKKCSFYLGLSDTYNTTAGRLCAQRHPGLNQLTASPAALSALLSSPCLPKETLLHMDFVSPSLFVLDLAAQLVCPWLRGRLSLSVLPQRPPSGLDSSSISMSPSLPRRRATVPAALPVSSPGSLHLLLTLSLSLLTNDPLLGHKQGWQLKDRIKYLLEALKNTTLKDFPLALNYLTWILSLYLTSSFFSLLSPLQVNLSLCPFIILRLLFWHLDVDRLCRWAGVGVSCSLPASASSASCWRCCSFFFSRRSSRCFRWTAASLDRRRFCPGIWGHILTWVLLKANDKNISEENTVLSVSVVAEVNIYLTFFPSSFLITGFSLFSCARLSDGSVAALLLLQDNFKK